MQTVRNVVIVSLIILVGFFGFVIYKLNCGDYTQLGSVSQNNQYTAMQLTGPIATSSDLVSGKITLGSVIITEDQVGAVVFYDATSTSYLPASARIADFGTAIAEGTYTFDVGLTHGLVCVSDDGFLFAGDWTITYRYGW